MLTFVGGVVKALAGPLLPILGKLGKGKGTGLGVVGTVVTPILSEAVKAGLPLINAENIVPLVNALTPWVQGLFACIGAFGAGRAATEAAQRSL